MASETSTTTDHDEISGWVEPERDDGDSTCSEVVER
jgi:hypothetical protein